VTGDLDAAGCDIGVYYGPGTKGSVKNATIENARYFGVVNYGGKVNVANSTISQIGNAPFDGTQHGVGIFFTTEATPGVAADVTAKGTIKGNILHSYQKGGITVRGVGASATIERNTLTGVGHVDFIAQNGIQVSFGGSATVKGNTVSGHWYTPADTESPGTPRTGSAMHDHWAAARRIAAVSDSMSSPCSNGCSVDTGMSSSGIARSTSPSSRMTAPRRS